MVAFTWRGPAAAQEVVNAGPLALLDLAIEAVIDRHLPAEPQRQSSHGHVLRVLLAARRCQPTALVNVADWAEKSGADIFANIPADKLNDDRLGRALDAFVEQRHALLASCTAQALQLTGLSLGQLHFDPTAVVLGGAYESSQPRPLWPENLPFTGDRLLPPAHLCPGYTADTNMLQLAIIDERGALPVLCPCREGNRHGHPDGLAGLITTASRTQSADLLFSQYKQQNYVELLQQQGKTPLAVSPVFLKSPRRVEALVCLLQIALQAYQVLERLYRQSVPRAEAVSEKRLTAERMLRIFRVYGLLVTRTAVGRVVHTTRLSNRQQQILHRLHFPTPAQILTRKLRPPPFG